MSRHTHFVKGSPFLNGPNPVIPPVSENSPWCQPTKEEKQS